MPFDKRASLTFFESTVRARTTKDRLPLRDSGAEQLRCTFMHRTEDMAIYQMCDDESTTNVRCEKQPITGHTCVEAKTDAGQKHRAAFTAFTATAFSFFLS